jgi:hypothetical protein
VVVAEEPKDDREPEARSVERIQLASPRAMLGELLSETRSVQRFNVSSGPVVADYVTADREEELLRVLDAIGARDVVVGPEGNRVEITFVLDAENSNGGGQNSRWNTEHVRGWVLAGSGGGLKDRLAKWG